MPIEQCAFSILPSSLRDPKVLLDLPRKAVPYADLDKLAPDIREAMNTGELVLLPEGLRYREKEFLVLDDAVDLISGVWDLPMVGGEALDVEHRYQMETGGPSVTLLNLEGAFVERDNVVCQLQDTFDDNEYGSGDHLEQRILEENLPKERADELRAQLRDAEAATQRATEEKALKPILSGSGLARGCRLCGAYCVPARIRAVGSRQSFFLKRQAAWPQRRNDIAEYSGRAARPVAGSVSGRQTAFGVQEPSRDHRCPGRHVSGKARYVQADSGGKAGARPTFSGHLTP